MYYTAIGILAILILFIENQEIMFNRKISLEQPTWRSYRRFLYFVLAYYITDALWGVFEMLGWYKLMFIDTSVYFVIMALCITCWTEYIVTCLDKRSKLRTFIVVAGALLAMAGIALVIINIFVPVLFTVSEDAVYTALNGRHFLLVFQILILLLVSSYALYIIIKKHTKEVRKYRMLALFGLIMSVFLIFQLWFPGLPLYAIAFMLGTCLLHHYVIVDEREIFRNKMEEAKKISTLRQSITSLLDNMPVNSYSKDVETGKYLACNNAFAEYAQKGTPDKIVGLTDYDLFDSKTADHFVEVDKIALGMDRPYVVYEDVKDINGNPKQFQTTKLKFIDETGRLCLLGMSLDITEMVKAKKENEQTMAAYQEALNASTIYENIVGMLSKDYFDLYYVDLETNEYVEYGSKTQTGHRSIEGRGTDFFESVKNDAPSIVFEEDLEKLLEMLDKDNLVKEIDEEGVFTYYYRLIIDDKPTYVGMKATRVAGDEGHIIIGISNVDAQIKDRINIENAKEEKKAYERLSAFSRNLMVLYVVDPKTDEYTQYSASDDFEKLGIAQKGNSFFEESFQNSLEAVYEEDRSMFHYLFTKENILNAIELDGIFVMDYRLMMDGKPNYVRLKAAEVNENGEDLLIVGIENVDLNVRREQQQAYELSEAREMATKDALTGVKNNHAFTKEKMQLKEQIDNGKLKELAVVICDINGLKLVNDTYGHQAGDELIKNACSLICNAFKHSKVFRIGGDEFAIICQGHDFEHIDELLSEMDASNRLNKEVQVAFGMARFEEGNSIEQVILSADKKMYAYKSAIKSENSKLSEKASEEAVYQFPEDLKRAYEASPLSFVYYQNIDDRAVPVLVSDGFCSNVGMPRETVSQWLSNNMFGRMHPDDVGVVSQISDDFLHQRGEYDVIFRCLLPTKDGSDKEEYMYMHGLGKWQTMPDGTELAVITYGNITVAQKATAGKTEDYLKVHKDRFYTDPLTELPNINYINEFGEEKLRKIKSSGKTAKIIFIDIYSMQSYNNQYGIEKGDKLLCLTAKTLIRCFPDALVARAVDDHFLIITDIDDNEKLEMLIQRANRMICKTAFGNTSGIRSGVSSVDESKNISMAIDHAKMALKRIENNMNRVVEFFSDYDNQLYFKNRYIIENFTQAMRNNDIKIYYHSLRRAENCKVAAFECLARWEDPERGMIYPGEFIPVLLKYHQLYKLDLYMFEQACKEVKIRYANGLPLVPVSINFSRQDFDHTDVVEAMNRIYDKYGVSEYVDKSYFIVEITEQDLETAEESFKEQLKKLRENNYRLWLDDFGSGYSSMSVFSQFDFDLIKFDMNLIRHLDDNGSVNRLLLEDIVRLARKLGVHTLIEGVETEEHLEFVRKIGCELAQGYYFNKPEPLYAILERVERTGIIKVCETPEERDEYNRKWFE